MATNSSPLFSRGKPAQQAGRADGPAQEHAVSREPQRGRGCITVGRGGGLVVIGGACQPPRCVDPARNSRCCYVGTSRRAMLVQASVWAWGGGKAVSYLPHQLLGMGRRNHPEVAGAGDL